MSATKKANISAKVLLHTYLTMHKETNGQFTIDDLAEKLGMTNDNTYQRMLKIKNEFAKAKAELPWVKRYNKTAGRKSKVDYAELAEYAMTTAGDIVKPITEPETPEVKEDLTAQLVELAETEDEDTFDYTNEPESFDDDDSESSQDSYDQWDNGDSDFE